MYAYKMGITMLFYGLVYNCTQDQKIPMFKIIYSSVQPISKFIYLSVQKFDVFFFFFKKIDIVHVCCFSFNSNGFLLFPTPTMLQTHAEIVCDWPSLPFVGMKGNVKQLQMFQEKALLKVPRYGGTGPKNFQVKNNLQSSVPTTL